MTNGQLGAILKVAVGTLSESALDAERGLSILVAHAAEAISLGIGWVLPSIRQPVECRRAIRSTRMLLPDTCFEDHYSIADLAKKWRISRESVRLLILDEPGIIRLSLGRTSMCRYSVPATVARRIHTRLTAPATMTKAA